MVESASQFWWQKKGLKTATPSDFQAKKRALFPVHVLEYSNNGIQGKHKRSLSSEATSPAAESVKQETIAEHGKGDYAVLLPDDASAAFDQHLWQESITAWSIVTCTLLSGFAFLLLCQTC